MRQHRFLGNLLTILLAVPCLFTRAAAAEEIRFKVIDGKLCARCTLKGRGGAIPAHVVIDPTLPVPLAVHENTAGLLGMEAGAPLEIRFENTVLAGLEGRAGKIAMLERLTRNHAQELGEIPCVAVVGSQAFPNRILELDVGGGRLRILPAADPEEAVSSGGAEAGSFTLDYQEREGGFLLSGRTSDGFPLQVKLSASEWDTRIDATVADMAGDAEGRLEELFIGDLNAARYGAALPVQAFEDDGLGADVLLGNRFLSHFRLSIDPFLRKLTFKEVRPPGEDMEAQVYFAARAGGDGEALERFIRDYPASRWAEEAAAVLLDLRLEERPLDPDRIRRAIDLRLATLPPERRGAAMAALADELIAGGNSALARMALEAGLDAADRDQDGPAAWRMHALLGFLALGEDDLEHARRHLLSAAFGMPGDPRVNLWMGELYEKMGKPVRAWSRYVNAAISDQPPEEAWAGLDRLHRDPGFRASFTMKDAEALLEGRVPAFHPWDRFEVQGSGPSRKHAHLVEFFNCVDHPGTLAPALAVKGLMEYFGEGNIALLAYHLPDPAPDPLASGIALSRAAFYGVAQAPAVFFDGCGPFEDEGDEGNVESLYAFYRDLARTTDGGRPAFRIDGRLRCEDRIILGTLSVSSQYEGEHARLHVLFCEKVLMLPSANGMVLHYHVARSGLSPEQGFPLDRGGGEFSIRAGLGEISASARATILKQEEERGIRFFMRPDYVDGRGGLVVAFVQDPITREVLAAETFGLDEASNP